MEFAHSMQTDLRSFGIIILQICMKKVFNQKELKFWMSWKSLKAQSDNKTDDSKCEQGPNERLSFAEEEQQVISKYYCRNF
jgi:hypothetical protein